MGGSLLWSIPEEKEKQPICPVRWCKGPERPRCTWWSCLWTAAGLPARPRVGSGIWDGSGWAFCMSLSNSSSKIQTSLFLSCTYMEIWLLDTPPFSAAYLQRSEGMGSQWLQGRGEEGILDADMLEWAIPIPRLSLPLLFLRMSRIPVWWPFHVSWNNFELVQRLSLPASSPWSSPEGLHHCLCSILSLVSISQQDCWIPTKPSWLEVRRKALWIWCLRK